MVKLKEYNNFAGYSTAIAVFSLKVPKYVCRSTKAFLLFLTIQLFLSQILACYIGWSIISA